MKLPFPMAWWIRRTLLASALVASSAASAALFEDDEARRAILDLRQRVEQANQQQRAETARQGEQLDQLRHSLLELNAQLELLRGELARMRGENEQLAREVAELQRKQADLAQGVEERIRQVEPQKTQVDGKEILVRPEERRDYEAALQTFRSGDFANAALAFTSFQRRYPGSGYTEAVLYWLGNSHYGKRDYREAMNAFRALVTGYPDHPRVPEALLSIAMCQIELKDRPAARRTLDELIKAHPDSEAAQEAKERLAALR
jgi:tol-pal system protein YbgF